MNECKTRLKPRLKHPGRFEFCVLKLQFLFSLILRIRLQKPRFSPLHESFFGLPHAFTHLLPRFFFCCSCCLQSWVGVFG